MKKLSLLFSVFILLTAFTCENEPLEGEFVTDDPDLTCEQASMNTVTAALNFVSATEATYTQLCIAYRNALEDQIAACGDPDGSIQAGIDVLGICTAEPDACEAATTGVVIAEQNFSNATEENYTDLCNIYKTFLQNKITECGDVDGSIQDIIDGLGDCTQTAVDGTLSLVAGTLPVNFVNVNVEVVGETITVTGENASGSYSIYFQVTQGQTGVDIIQNFVLTLNGTDYVPAFETPEDFTSTISTNSTGILVGSFYGFVINDDNGVISLTQGIINLNY